MKPDAFIALIAAGAQESMRATRVPASFTIAQAALESAWGESGLAKSAMNLFGVKADKAWKGPTVTLPTREFINGKGVTVPAAWRKYSSWSDCLTDHAQFFIVNKRYAPAFQHVDNAEQFTLAIAAAGYATDPQYGAKVIAVIRSHNLIAFDRPEAKP